MLRKVLISLFILMSVLILQAQTLSQNVKFSDLNGKEYDLFQLLESGKYVYIQTAYDG